MSFKNFQLQYESESLFHHQQQIKYLKHRIMQISQNNPCNLPKCHKSIDIEANKMETHNAIRAYFFLQ